MAPIEKHRGTIVETTPYALQRDPRWWGLDADSYDPPVVADGGAQLGDQPAQLDHRVRRTTASVCDRRIGNRCRAILLGSHLFLDLAFDRDLQFRREVSIRTCRGARLCGVRVPSALRTLPPDTPVLAAIARTSLPRAACGWRRRLVSYLVSPAKTQAVVMRLQDWLRADRQPIFVVVLGVVGAWMVTNGPQGLS
jgi:hypothetical protein